MKQNKNIPSLFANKTYLDPTYDPAFKEFFDSEDALKDFLDGVLGLDGDDKIKKLTFTFDKSLHFRVPQRKKVVVDIFATTGSGRFLNIEMQNLEHDFFIDRIFLYKAFLIIKGKKEMEVSPEFANFSQKEQKRKRYELPETISIWICNFDLPGAKGEYIAEQDGGIINVGDGGTLTIREMATLQNSRSSAKGAAVFVASGGHAAMSGGTVRNNESDGAGAGIYLDYEAENRHATLMLSGSPNFGGKGLYPTGEINSKVGNFQEGSLVAKSNGGKLYTRARQDIYIAGFDI